MFYLLISVSCKEKEKNIEITAKTVSSIIVNAHRAFKDTTRFIKDHKFSPKYYKSGWIGGSKAALKSYKLWNIGKKLGKYQIQ